MPALRAAQLITSLPPPSLVLREPGDVAIMIGQLLRRAEVVALVVSAALGTGYNI
jgi:hypothetical protein